LGCDIIQGYYISHPVTIEQLEIFLNNEKAQLAKLLNIS